MDNWRDALYGAIIGLGGGVANHLFQHAIKGKPLSLKVAIINAFVSFWLAYLVGVSFGGTYGEYIYGICGVVGLLSFQLIEIIEMRGAGWFLDRFKK